MYVSKQYKQEQKEIMSLSRGLEHLQLKAGSDLAQERTSR